MKTIHYINATIYTLFVLSIIINGIAVGSVGNNDFEVFILLGLIVLGITQPLLALILIFYIPELNKTNRRLLYSYWLVVSFFFLLVFIASTKIMGELFIKYIGIAIIFTATNLLVFATYKIQKQ